MQRAGPDTVTQNMLILELSTMIVAIALALNSQDLTKVDVPTIVGFAATSSLVIWFWWSYVVDRLRFPPRGTAFPFRDVLLLLLITLIPFVMRSRISAYDNGLFGAILLVWAWLVRGFMGQLASEGGRRAEALAHLRREFSARALSGLAFLAGVPLGLYSNQAGFAYFGAATALTIAAGALRSLRRERNPGGCAGDNPQLGPALPGSSPENAR